MEVNNRGRRGRFRPNSVAKDAKVMELWQHINTDFTDPNTCNSSTSQWNFQYLEITGQNCEIPRNIDEICKRIPKLKIGTRSRYVKPRVESKIGSHFDNKPPRRAIKSAPSKLQNGKIFSLKVIVSKTSKENLSSNCICTCESPKNDSGNEDIRSHTGLDEDSDDVSYEELLDIIEKYEKGIQKNGSYAICNLSRNFTCKRNAILNEEDVKKVLKILDSNDHTVQKHVPTTSFDVLATRWVLLRTLVAVKQHCRCEPAECFHFKGPQQSHGVTEHEMISLGQASAAFFNECILMLIKQLGSSSATAEMLLQHDVLEDLIYLMLMGTTDDVKIQAVCCIAKLTEREEHSDWWIETMMISGAEALFDVLSADEENVSESLIIATLEALLSLANNQKMATMLINHFDLSSIIDLTRSKMVKDKAFGSPETQKIATRVLTSLLSHNCAIVEQFISKYDEAVSRVIDILQYCPCPQQQEAARFLSMLTLFEPGLDPVISHRVTEHLLWAMTCSHCRFVRENTSKAFKNMTQQSDKEKLLLSLQQFSMKQIDPQPCNAKTELESFKTKPTSSKSISDSQRHLPVSKLEKAMAEIFSVLCLSFETDSLHLFGSSRAFINDCQVESTRETKRTSTKGVNEQYLGSLRVLVNILVTMATLIRLNDKDENDKEIACSLGNGANLSLAALFVECGGLQFLKQLQFLSNKLQNVNPPNFHGIDPTILPPKEIISSIKNARTELIFKASDRKQKPKNRYPDFGIHTTELQFIVQAMELLLSLAQATAQDFDPVQEDLNVFLNSRPPPVLSKKRKISFHSSTLIDKSVVRMNGSVSPRGGEDRETHCPGSKKPSKLQSSTRSLSSRISLTSMDRRFTATSQATRPSSAPTTLEPGTSSRNEMIHYVKQSLLGCNVVLHLAVWVTCGVYDVQTGVIKVLRYLMHAHNAPKRVTSDQAPKEQPQEAWTNKTKKYLRHAKPSHRPSVSSLSKPKNKSTHLSNLCVRHVIQYCGAYLLDLLRPPATEPLGRMSLMVIREAIINGESDSRLNIVKLGCLAQVIDYIRGTEDVPELQSLGLLVLRSLVSSSQALKQLLLAHGGMNLVMALNEYKEGLVKEEAANTLRTFTRASTNTESKARGLPAHSKKRFRTQTSDDDIWDHVTKKWQGQDKVAKLLTKFNVKY